VAVGASVSPEAPSPQEQDQGSAQRAGHGGQADLDAAASGFAKNYTDSDVKAADLSAKSDLEGFARQTIEKIMKGDMIWVCGNITPSEEMQSKIGDFGLLPQQDRVQALMFMCKLSPLAILTEIQSRQKEKAPVKAVTFQDVTIDDENKRHALGMYMVEYMNPDMYNDLFYLDFYKVSKTRWKVALDSFDGLEEEAD